MNLLHKEIPLRWGGQRRGVWVRCLLRGLGLGTHQNTYPNAVPGPMFPRDFLKIKKSLPWGYLSNRRNLLAQ